MRSAESSERSARDLLKKGSKQPLEKQKRLIDITEVDEIAQAPQESPCIGAPVSIAAPSPTSIAAPSPTSVAAPSCESIRKKKSGPRGKKGRFERATPKTPNQRPNQSKRAALGQPAQTSREEVAAQTSRDVLEQQPQLLLRSGVTPDVAKAKTVDDLKRQLKDKNKVIHELEVVVVDCEMSLAEQQVELGRQMRQEKCAVGKRESKVEKEVEKKTGA